MHEDLITFVQSEKQNPFDIQLCGISYCDGTYMINRQNSWLWCMEYVIEGKGYVTVDDVSFTAEKGDIYILPAGRNQYYYSDTENPWTKIWFNITGDLIEKIIESYKLNNVFHVKGLDLLYLFEEFLENSKNAISYEEAIKFGSQTFLKIIQEIYDYTSYENPIKNIAGIFKNKIDRITDFNISFDSLIDEMYCTKSHIIREFKKEYQITPYNYLLKKKLAAAKIMLESTGLSITEISYLLGFNDCHYFSNFFKKRTGISPVNYRKKS